MESLHAEQVENAKLKKQEYNKRQYGKNKEEMQKQYQENKEEILSEMLLCKEQEGEKTVPKKL